MLNGDLFQHSVWRNKVDTHLNILSQWLQQNDLLSANVKSQIDDMRMHSRSDKIMVAFVAEFSSGKSELINAVFFAHYGRRIIPTSAGRTTMCPTEFGYDERDDVCLRLLPIQTRLETQTLLEWRTMLDRWTKIELNTNDVDQLVETIGKVTETIKVTVEEARLLGFWNDEVVDNSSISAQGTVDIPKWRHALINIEHPLLRQGLVLLDTPGLNAMGAEPELTMSLLPQAQAVVFILATDTGVKASDMAIWREFLSGKEDDVSRFVVLNKIDTLWDELKTPEQNAALIEHQRLDSAHILGVSEDRVVAISAQKGLLAKISKDADLLERSHLQTFENMLGQRIVQRRYDIVHSHFKDHIASIHQKVERQLSARSWELDEQIAEMNNLRGKNEAVIRQQQLRVAKESEDFETSVAKIQAIRVVHHKTLQKIYSMLSNTYLLKEVALLKTALTESGLIKLGVRKEYSNTFLQLNKLLAQAQEKVDEVHMMFSSMFKKLNGDYGFNLQIESPPQLRNYEEDLRAIQASHDQYLGVGNFIKLSQQEFVDRLLRALVSQLHDIFEKALNDVERWSRSVASQIDTQLRERRHGLKRRLTSIERAESASSSLDERIQEIQAAMLEVQHERTIFNSLLEKILPNCHEQQEVLDSARS